jgi:hypothetical protein
MSASWQGRLIKYISLGSKGCILFIIVAALFVVPLFVIIGGPPSGGASVEGQLKLSPVSTTTAGHLQVKPEQAVTAIFTFANRTDQVSLSRRILVAGRGPQICEHGWDRAPAVSFQAIENVILKPNETRTYRKVRAFQTPGVYRVETRRQTLDGGWEGFASTTKGEYIIVDGPDSESFDTSCIHP